MTRTRMPENRTRMPEIRTGVPRNNGGCMLDHDKDLLEAQNVLGEEETKQYLENYR